MSKELFFIGTAKQIWYTAFATLQLWVCLSTFSIKLGEAP